MKDLLKPVTYRLKRYQDEWLKRQAEDEGHDQKVFVIRRLIDQAMKRTSKSN